MRIAHVITGLGTGGAETMLLKLVEQLRGSGVESTIVSLTGRGDLAARLESAGAAVDAVDMSKSILGLPRALASIRGRLKRSNPDLVQTWMYHADLVGGLAARLAGIRPVIWNVRVSALGRGVNPPSTMMTMWTCARLSSRVPERIVCNSATAAREHEALGYDRSRLVIIPNGFDSRRFQPDGEAREAVRRELDIGWEDVVVGQVSRWHPQKDLRSMIRAAAALFSVRPDIVVVLCGSGLTQENDTLMSWVRETGHESRFRLIGRRDDVARVVASFDVAVSSSVGEGFSNAIGEAMSSGVPCVVTDVGDSAAIVGETGIVVPARDSRRMAEAILRLAESADERARLGRLARRRIEDNFGIEVVANRYVALWKEAIACAA